MTDPDFPVSLPAAGTADPAKPWRVVDASGDARDYYGRDGARSAMYAMRGSSAVYAREDGGYWRLYETLLREERPHVRF